MLFLSNTKIFCTTPRALIPWKMSLSELPPTVKLESHPFARNKCTSFVTFAPGSIILSIPALVTVLLPDKKGLRCDLCNRRPSSQSESLSRCTGCASYWYCNTTCKSGFSSIFFPCFTFCRSKHSLENGTPENMQVPQFIYCIFSVPGSGCARENGFTPSVNNVCLHFQPWKWSEFIHFDISFTASWPGGCGTSGSLWEIFDLERPCEDILLKVWE
jgi:hypothetical protein